MSRQLRLTKFRELSLSDPFFDSLKAGYADFPAWFRRKADEDLYIVDDDGRLSGMIYLKSESGTVDDVEPPLPALRWLKVGTLKIEGRGTKLGERVIKKILDTAISEDRNGIYITVFHLHDRLIALFQRYGFTQRATKTTRDGVELVLVRILSNLRNDTVLDYPFIHSSGRRKWLLAIYPEYHSRLLPDSILRNEPTEIVQDVSHTNTIHKIYISRLRLTRMSPSDIIVFYRTTDGQGPARYRSVATSICVVEEVRRKTDFDNLDQFLKYVAPHSVFSESELRTQFKNNADLFVAKMTYNVAFSRRITRGNLLDQAQISEEPRWDLRELSDRQFKAILAMGAVNARLIVD